jgi:hypothetical protein
MLFGIRWIGAVASEVAREEWIDPQERRMWADRARARWRIVSFIRALRRRPGTIAATDSPKHEAFRWRHSYAVVPVSEIVVARRAAAPTPGLPARRHSHEAWRRLYLGDLGEFPVLTVHRLASGFRLGEDPFAAMVLEVLRARGVKLIRVRFAEPADRRRQSLTGLCCSGEGRSVNGRVRIGDRGADGDRAAC